MAPIGAMKSGSWRAVEAEGGAVGVCRGRRHVREAGHRVRDTRCRGRRDAVVVGDLDLGGAVLEKGGAEDVGAFEIGRGLAGGVAG